MYQYIFVLGRTPLLSLAELDAILPRYTPSFSWDIISDEIGTISSETPIDTATLMKTVGGTVKIGQIALKIDMTSSEKDVLSVLSDEETIGLLFPHREKKIHIGISVYNAGTSPHLIQPWRHIIKTFSSRYKSILTDKGHTVGYVTIKDRTLSAASIIHNRLMTHGSELLFLITDDQLIIGRTSALQDISLFSLKDFGRPAKDKRSGILPPKIAQMMINIANKPPSATLLDPCCGSGTIIQEALCLGYTKIYGSDISKKAVQDTQTNISWLVSQPPFHALSSTRPTLTIHDATQPFRHISPSSIDCIVTEPYLGPPLFKLPAMPSAKRMLQDISRTLTATLKQLKPVLRESGVIVMIFPSFSFPGKTLHLPLVQELSSIGYTVVSPFSSRISDHSYFRDKHHISIMYGGTHHIVQREIFILRK